MNLSNNFFKKSTTDVAKSLLGCHLIHKTKDGTTIGKIIETEAYLKDDPASHSFVGKTNRNSVMFGPPGRAYIYFIYGMYYCFNVVTNKKNIGEAVLIRELEPLKGIEIMKINRGINDIGNLCNGPAKLVQAMGITKNHNGVNLTKGNLIIRKINDKKIKIIQKKRIGISKAKNLKLRFKIEDN